MQDPSLDNCSDTLRDAYGFPVPETYSPLFRQFSPLWAEEEAERAHKWDQWLRAYRRLNQVPSDEDDAQLMERALSQYTAGTSVNAAPVAPQATVLLQQLRALVQMGVPMRRRSAFWAVFLDIKSKRKEGEYAALVSMVFPPSFETNDKPQPASEVLRQFEEEWLPQIDKDLHRTFPDHPLMDTDGRAALRRILSAYALRNPAVGYCQGENFLAAAFMLLFPEEDAFWCLCTAIEDLLPGYFDEKMINPQVDGLVLSHLLRGSAPRVADHLEKLQVDVPSATSAWFLVAFLNTLPIETTLRVWDVLFFERSSVVLFRIALALVDIYSQALLETDDSSEAYLMLQALGPMSYDSSRLVDSACIGFGHVKDSALRVLRDKYRPEVMQSMESMFSSATDLELCFEAATVEAAAAPLSRSQSFAEAVAASGTLGLSLSKGALSDAWEVPNEEDLEHTSPLCEQPLGSKPSPSPRSPQRDRSPSPSRLRPLGAKPSSPRSDLKYDDASFSTPMAPFRRSQSAVALSGHVRRASSTHHYLQRRIDLYSLAAFVPDLNHPKIAALYQIAAKPAPKKKDSDTAVQIDFDAAESTTAAGTDKIKTRGMTLDELLKLPDGMQRLNLGALGRTGAGLGEEGATVDIGSVASLIKALKYGQSTEINSLDGFQDVLQSSRVTRRFTDGGALLRAGARKGTKQLSVGLLPANALPLEMVLENPDSPGTIEEKIEQLQKVRDALLGEVQTAERRRNAAAAAAADAAETAEALHTQVRKIQSEIDDKMGVLRDLYGSIADIDTKLAEAAVVLQNKCDTIAASASRLEELKVAAESQGAAVKILMNAVAKAASSPPGSPAHARNRR